VEKKGALACSDPDSLGDDVILKVQLLYITRPGNRVMTSSGSSDFSPPRFLVRMVEKRGAPKHFVIFELLLISGNSL
jgi:hypothetical protein